MVHYDWDVFKYTQVYFHRYSVLWLTDIFKYTQVYFHPYGVPWLTDIFKYTQGYLVCCDSLGFSYELLEIFGELQ